MGSQDGSKMSFPAGAGLLTDLLMLLDKTNHSRQHKHSLVLCHCYLLLVCMGEVGPHITAFSGSLSLPDYAAEKKVALSKASTPEAVLKRLQTRERLPSRKTKAEPVRNLVWICIFISFCVVSSAVMQMIKEKIVFVLVNLSLRCCNSRYACCVKA